MARTSANWHPGLSDAENMKRLEAQQAKAAETGKRAQAGKNESNDDNKAISDSSPPTTPTRTERPSKKGPKTPSSGLAAIKLEDPDYSPVSARAAALTGASNMAKQRASKRHLVRWTEDLDIQLLLTIQSECNACGIAIPWDAIGNTLGIGTSGGAIIQHLAKTRSRRVTAGLPVPPPLRRGGGIPRLLAASGPKIPAVVRRRDLSAKRVSPKSGKMPRKKVFVGDNEDDNDDEGAWDSDPDGEYGKSRTKRPRNARRHAIKDEDSTESEAESPNKAGDKRKRGNNSGVQSPTPLLRGEASTCTHDRIKMESLSSSVNNSDSGSEDDRADADSCFVGAGSKFLELEDDHDTNYQTGEKTIPKRKSMVVKLPIGRQTKALAVLQRSEGTSSIIDNSADHQRETVGEPERQAVGHYQDFAETTMQQGDHFHQPLSFAHDDSLYNHGQGIDSHEIFRPSHLQFSPAFNGVAHNNGVYCTETNYYNPPAERHHQAFDSHFGTGFHHGLPISQPAKSISFQDWGATRQNHDGLPHIGLASLSNIDTNCHFGNMVFDSGFHDSETAVESVSPAELHHSPLRKPVIRPTASVSMSSGLSTSLPTPGSGLEQGDVFAGAVFPQYMHDE